jgi:hypothetical protein
MSSLHPDVVPQLAGLALDPGRPLVISDADEVLFLFMREFETYLDMRGMYFDWASYALNGNLRHRHDNAQVASERVPEMIEDFFEHHTDLFSPVPGAAESLAALSERAQVVVLTNIPPKQRERRARCLALHGMDFPVIANVGAKGLPVRHLAEQVQAPVFFLDDSPRNLQSVKLAAEGVDRLHFVADARLHKLLGPVTEHHLSTTEWTEARAFIERRLTEAGF